MSSTALASPYWVMPLVLSDPPVPADWSRHSPASDPGECAALLAAVPPKVEDIGATARNLIAHYRAQAADLPDGTRDDVHLRWDGWGALPDPDRPVEGGVLTLVDEVTDLLLPADAGDVQAEARLYSRYLNDGRLSPGDTVTRFSPFGDAPVQVILRR
jgi:hypothetical protein